MGCVRREGNVDGRCGAESKRCNTVDQRAAGAGTLTLKDVADFTGTISGFSSKAACDSA
jgi:hypothetical protein